jgi:hypothetical protein
VLVGLGSVDHRDRRKGLGHSSLRSNGAWAVASKLHASLPPSGMGAIYSCGIV